MVHFPLEDLPNAVREHVRGLLLVFNFRYLEDLLEETEIRDEQGVVIGLACFLDDGFDKLLSPFAVRFNFMRELLLDHFDALLVASGLVLGEFCQILIDEIFVQIDLRSVLILLLGQADEAP